MHFKNTNVRFRNNKPYLLKKTIITITVLGFFTYLCVSLDWLTFLILFLFIGLPIIFKIRKQPSEGKGFFGKVKNFYKNMYKNYVIDSVPMDFTCNEDEILIVLHKAEIIKGKTAVETFAIKKNSIAGIMFDDTDQDILIMFQEAKVNVLDEETKNELRNITQQDSTICFSVKENPNIVDELKEKGYEIEFLSEIEDEEEETEDPELVAKQNENENENITTDNMTKNNESNLNQCEQKEEIFDTTNEQ